MVNRREYTEEFKLGAIKLVKETDQTIAKIGRDLGIDGSMLSKWVKKYDEKMCGAYAFPGTLSACLRVLGIILSHWINQFSVIYCYSSKVTQEMQIIPTKELFFTFYHTITLWDHTSKRYRKGIQSLKLFSHEG